MLEFCDQICDKLRVKGGFTTANEEALDSSDGDDSLLAISDLTNVASELNKWKRDRKSSHADDLEYAAFLIEIAREAAMLCNAERGYVYLKAKSSRSLECKPILSRASYNIPFGDEGGIAGKAASEMQAIVANAATGFISPNDPTLRMSASRNIDDPLDWIAVPIVTIDKSWGSSRKYVSGVLVCRFRSGCKAEPHNVEACKQFAGFIANLYLRQNLVLGDEGSRKNSSAASKSPGDYDDDAERSHTVQSLLQKIERWKLRMA